MSTETSGTSGVEYREVPGFPGYRVGNDGTLWSKRRSGKRPETWVSETWRLIHGVQVSSGHLQITLFDHGRRHAVFVHRLILESFVGPCPEGMECRHLNGNPKDNRLANIAWGTRKENHADRVRLAERNGPTVLTKEIVLAARARVKSGECVTTIAVEYGLNHSNLCKAVKGRTWFYLPGAVSPSLHNGGKRKRNQNG